jgi:membrane-associated HD superfamily phosphohydrolase
MDKFKKLLIAFGTVTPSVLLAHLGDWLNLFSHVGLSHRAWDAPIKETSAAVSVFVSLWLFVWLHDKPKPYVRKRFHATFILLVIAIVSCVVVQIPFGLTTTYSGYDAWLNLWSAIYFVMLTLAASTVLTFVLVTISSDKPCNGSPSGSA